MVYDDSLNDNDSNYSCKGEIDKANHMLKNNNFFEKTGIKVEITKP